MKKQNLLFILLFFINLINAQNVQNYYFSHSIGSYVETSATATLLPTVRADDFISVAQDIGFNFVYDGSTYTQFKMSSNGFISFGSGTSSRVSNTFISTLYSSSRPFIAPLWDDLSGTSTNSVAAYEVTGSAPNRVLTVEWRNWFWDRNAANAATPNPTISFQVKLYETSNNLEFIYRQENGSVSTLTGGASIGIGSSNSTSYLNLTSVSNPAVSNSNHVINIITKPLTGQIFSFSPCAPILVPTITSTATSCSSAGTSTISNYSASNTYTFSPATSGITIASSGLISGLAEGTSYTVIATNEGCSSVASASFSNATQLPTPLVPTISSTAPTCIANGFSTITNYDATLNYVFNPAGPTINASGLIQGMVLGTSYSVTSTNASLCTSAVSNNFVNIPMLIIPVVPTISVTAPTCLANGFATITNYVSGQIYTFNPAGPSVDATGLISGMTFGTSYVVSAGNGSCTSVNTTSFVITQQLPLPTIVSVTNNGPTCIANGFSTITNYDATLNYVFNPAGPTINASGLIQGMVLGTSYSVTSTNASLCTSAVSNNFVNIPMLIIPVVPTISVTAPTCLANGFATITNYVSGQIYTFNPAGPSVDATGLISGLTFGTSYVVSAGNVSCSSVDTALFSVNSILPTPVAPVVSVTAPTCLANGFSTITNYDATLNYVFNPAGPTINASGLIQGMVLGTSYSVTSTNASLCTSAVSNNFVNSPMLITPVVPTISVTAPTCLAAGFATITNYSAANTYTFSPTGPTVGAGGIISGAVIGTSYTVQATSGTCTSAASLSFTNQAQLPTPAVPTLSTTAPTCTANGFTTITNYNASNTYTFSPVGPTVGAGGAISSMTVGTSYTVIATNGGCSSVSSDSFLNSSILILPTVTASTSLNCLNNQFSININVTSLGVGSFILTDGVSTWPITSIGIINLGPYNFGTSININISDPLNLICNSLVDTFSVLGCPPANDDCLNAIALTPGAVFGDNDIVGTNFAAAASVGETAPGCANYLGGDIWYSAVVPASGSLTFELNTNVGGITDGAGAVYSGSCGALVLVDCDDSSSATPNDQPLISVTGRTPGEVLYFRVWESGNDISGTFLVSAYDASLSSGSFDNANLSAYPNPVKDVLNVSYTSEISSVKIINMLGQEVISKNINATSSQIDMSQLSAGTYIVNVTVGDTMKTLKVVKQ